MTPDLITCHKCGHEIGWMIEGGIYVPANVAQKDVHGWCVNCGSGVHHSIDTKMVRKILDIFYELELRERQSCQKSTPN